MQTSKKDTAVKLKETMRQIPSPVVIVTAAFGKQRRGTTVGSFTSLSLNPPLVSFNIDRQSQMHDVLERATHFGIHLPLPKDEKLCNHFAKPDQSGEQQFQAVSQFRNGYGTPVLKQISSFLQCRAYDRLEAGDHTIFVGEVTEINEQERKQAGIFYCDRKYRSIGKPAVNNNSPIKRVG